MSYILRVNPLFSAGIYTAQKMKFRISSVNATDLVTFTEGILNGKLHLLRSITYAKSTMETSKEGVKSVER